MSTPEELQVVFDKRLEHVQGCEAATDVPAVDAEVIEADAHADIMAIE